MSKKVKRIIASSVAAVMVLGLMAGCKDNSSSDTPATDAPKPVVTDAPAPADDGDKTETPVVTDPPAPVDEPTPADNSSTVPLVLANGKSEGTFSPYFYQTAYDANVWGMTAVGNLTTDRLQVPVLDAIKGEYRNYEGTDYFYDGIVSWEIVRDEAADTTSYIQTIRDGVKFADGAPVTAKDLAFSYYVEMDPAYVGLSTMYTMPIVGLQEYREQMSSEASAKYDEVFDEFYAAYLENEDGKGDMGPVPASVAEPWAAKVTALWKAEIQAIVDYCEANVLNDARAARWGLTVDEVKANEGLKVAFGMYGWGFGSYVAGPALDEDGNVKPNEDGTIPEVPENVGHFVGAVTGTDWDISNGQYPTIDDYYAETYAGYDGDPFTFFDVEHVAVDPSAGLKLELKQAMNALETGAAGGVTSISGIEILGDNKVSVTIKGYQVNGEMDLSLTIAPMHYYGEESLWDPSKGLYGFKQGDLGHVKSLSGAPMGAGPYKFVKYEDRVAYFEANPYYWRGEPKIKYLQWKDTNTGEEIPAIVTGAADVSSPSFSTEALAQIRSENSNGELDGDVITTVSVLNNGWGYVAINAQKVNINGDPGSEASKNFRKGFATIIAAYRELSVDSYYGDQGSVINYPISNTSWAAPLKTDQGYEVAYSKDVSGAEIYNTGMSSSDRIAAAIEAAKGYWKAAGAVWDDASGKFTDVPGGKLEYQFDLTAQGTSDHPAFVMITKSIEEFNALGFNVSFNNPSDSNEVFARQRSGENEFSFAAWGSGGVEPAGSLKQIFGPDSIPGRGSNTSNAYGIDDQEIVDIANEALGYDDRNLRKSLYMNAYNIIMDWGSCIPIYQRNNVSTVSTARVNIDTLEKDPTPFWDAVTDNIQKLEMR